MNQHRYWFVVISLLTMGSVHAMHKVLEEKKDLYRRAELSRGNEQHKRLLHEAAQEGSYAAIGVDSCRSHKITRRKVGYCKAEYDYARGVLEKEGKVGAALDMYKNSLRDSRIQLDEDQKKVYPLALRRVEGIAQTGNLHARALLASEYLRGYCGDDKRAEGIELLKKFCADDCYEELADILPWCNWDAVLSSLQYDKLHGSSSPYYDDISYHVAFLKERGIIFKQNDIEAVIYLQQLVSTPEYKKDAIAGLQRLATKPDALITPRAFYGEWCVDNKKVNEAIDVFQTILDDIERHHKNNKQTLDGLRETLSVLYKQNGRGVFIPHCLGDYVIRHLENLKPIMHVLEKLKPLNTIDSNSFLARYYVTKARELKMLGAPFNEVAENFKIAEQYCLDAARKSNFNSLSRSTLANLYRVITEEYRERIDADDFEWLNAYIYYTGKAAEFGSGPAIYADAIVNLDCNPRLTPRAAQLYLKKLDELAQRDDKHRLMIYRRLVKYYNGTMKSANSQVTMCNRKKAAEYESKAEELSMHLLDEPARAQAQAVIESVQNNNCPQAARTLLEMIKQSESEDMLEKFEFLCEKLARKDAKWGKLVNAQLVMKRQPRN